MRSIIITSTITAAIMLLLIIKRKRDRNTYEAMRFRLDSAMKTKCICGLYFDNRFAGKYCFECGSVIVDAKMAGYVGPDGVLFDEQGMPIMNLIRRER